MTGAPAAPATAETTARTGPLQGMAVTLAAPCYGGMVAAGFALSLMRSAELLRAQGAALAVRMLTNESLVTRARCLLAAQALAMEGATHLLFIDADIEWRPEDLARLLAHGARGVPVVGGAYPMKNVNWSAVAAAARAGLDPASAQAIYALNPVDPPASPRPDGLIPVRELGTGFLLIALSALRALAASGLCPTWRLQPHLQREHGLAETIPALFDTAIDPDSGEFLSEDYAFCRAWRRLGGEVLMDPAITLTHVGTYRFRGDPTAAAAAAWGR